MTEETDIVKDKTNQQEDTVSEKRIRKRLSSSETNAKGFKRAKSAEQPRWHNQSYMLFLALRQHTEKSLPRGELIKRALALDKKISSELHLPRVFRGRTPANSASAILTNNLDHYFIPFKPEGSRSTHFKLAYEPGDTEKAVQEYQKWCKKLVEHDWPYCFGIPKVDLTQKEQESHYHTPLSDTDSQKLENSEDQGETIIPNIAVSETATIITVEDTELKKGSVVTTLDNTLELKETTVISTVVETKTTLGSPKNSKKQPEIEPAPMYTLDQLDLSDIPKHWSDIVEVRPSLIPGAGNGLFAKRKLPYNTPIGFYFGVPMTEDEFDSLKDRVGRSSEYSIMYRRTVLDATDEKGEPVTDQESSRFCAFHFMNETVETGANVAFVEGVVVNQVICWTRKDIEAGEELLVWYGADVNRYWDDKENRKKEEELPKTTTTLEHEQEVTLNTINIEHIIKT